MTGRPERNFLLIHDHGSPRRYIRAKGSVEGGNNRVKLRTINGNIEVKTAS